MLTVADLPERIRSRIAIVEHGGCWVWQGWKNDDGYGYVHWEGRDQPVHRVVFKLLVGPIAEELDHRCRNRACCNPADCEQVTHAENQRRLSAAQTSCRRSGHDWTNPANVRVRRNGRRYCGECARQDSRARYSSRSAA